MTAYNQYAIDAFDRGAVDYLLKPIAPERLAATVQRVKARLASGVGRRAALAAIVEQLRATAPRRAPKPPPLEWITASVGKETRLILVDDVAYFKADDKYTVVDDRRGRGAHPQAHPRAPRRARPGDLQADPPLDHREHEGDRRRSRATTRGRGTLRLKNRPETLPVSLTFMPLFKNM